MTKAELKKTAKESVREALAHEMINLRAMLVPFVSAREQKDIEKRFGKPSGRTAKRRTIQV